MNDADAYAAGIADTLGLVRMLATAAPLALVLGAQPPPTMRRLGEIIATVDPSHLHVLRPFNPAEAIAPKKAAELAGRSESCVRGWVERYGIGRRVVGSLCISRQALAMLLDDDVTALAAYLSGDRASPFVARYLEAAARQTTGSRLK